MTRIVRSLLVGFIVLLAIGVPWLYAHYGQKQMRNFHIVRDGVLYRSGQMTVSGVQRAIHDYGIKTVVTLRDADDPRDPPPDLEEERYCKGQGIKYVRIRPRNWWAPDGSIPAEKGIKKFREVMDHADNHPVLVHCFAGVHRTGAYVAVYRMEYEHWSNDKAIREVHAGGYRHLDEELDVLEFLETYQPRWKRPER